MTLNFQRNFLHGQKVSMSAAMIETGGGGVETDKNSRLLYLYEMLVHGEGLQKKEAAARFGVNERALIDFDGTLIVVSHDRDFLDGLVTKVYEFGNKKVKEHLCGIYEFLEKKKMDSLQELEK